MGTSEHTDTTVDVARPGAELPRLVRPVGRTERPQGGPCWVGDGSSWSAGIGPAHDRVGLIGCDVRVPFGAPSIDTAEAAVSLTYKNAYSRHCRYHRKVTEDEGVIEREERRDVTG